MGCEKSYPNPLHFPSRIFALIWDNCQFAEESEDKSEENTREALSFSLTT